MKSRIARDQLGRPASSQFQRIPHDSDWPAHPEDDILPWNKLIVAWIYPLISLASERTLEEDDVLFSPKLLRVKEVTMRIQHAWRDEVERARLSKKPREPTLAWAIWYAYKTQFIWAFVFQLLFCFGQIGQPYLIGELVEHIRTGKGGITYGIGIALAMAASSLACSVLFSAFIFFLRRQGIMVRTAMMMACYERSLALTTASRSTLTVK